MIIFTRLSAAFAFGLGILLIVNLALASPNCSPAGISADDYHHSSCSHALYRLAPGSYPMACAQSNYVGIDRVAYHTTKTKAATDINIVGAAIEAGNSVKAGDARVIKTDISTSNGVIHAIKSVVLPPYMACRPDRLGLENWS